MKKSVELDRQEIRKSLPHGTLKRISDSTGVQQATISQWFAGIFNSDKIEESVLKQYEIQQRLKRKRIKRYHEAKMLA